MTRNIVVVVLFCFVVNLTAQTNYDTVYFSGKKFVEHFVKGGESLKKIANLHNVTTTDIKHANELNKRLYYNQKLYIPIYLNKVEEEAVSVKGLLFQPKHKLETSIINIGLLMPYYLVKNDTMFNNYDDVSQIPNIYYKKSENALSFHIGVELAIDSLRKNGKKIVLHAFDTNNDTLELRKIINSNKLDKMDIIIGPLYSKSFQILCKKYGKDAEKILISPLSRNNKGFRNYASVYQISPSNKMQAELLTKYLIKKKLREKIIILHDAKQKGLTSYIKNKFKQKKKTVTSFQVIHTQVDSIRKYFGKKQNVLLFSTNKAFVSKLLGSIGSMDSISTVFTFESIKSYENLDITNLMELDVHIPNSGSLNYSNEFDQAFLDLFQKKYYTNIRKYTNIGYNIIMHFCGASEVYNFKKMKGGYFENSSMSIYHYADYQLTELK